MKKNSMRKCVVWLAAVMTISGMGVCGVIVDWDFNEGSGPDTANLAGSNMRLQLGAYYDDTSDPNNPAWVTVDGHTCIDIDNYNMNNRPVYAKHRWDWANSDFMSLTPSTYSIEMIFQYQTMPPSSSGWDNNSPQSIFMLVNAESTKTIYQIRTVGAKFEFLSTANGTSNTTISNQSWNTPYVTAVGDWMYVGVWYDGANATLFVRNLTKEAEGAASAANAGTGTWGTGLGFLSVGSEITGTGGYRRSSDALFDRVRISSGVVAEADRLYNIIPEPATLLLLTAGLGVFVGRKK